MVKKKDTKGVTAEKDEFSEWFTQIMLKADLADYTSVSGAIVFRPTAYAIWERIRDECDKRFKKIGVQNCYFPLLIPEKSFDKLKSHTEGNDGARHQALFRDAYELNRQEQITILRPDYHPGANDLSRANSRVWSIPFEH